MTLMYKAIKIETSIVHTQENIMEKETVVSMPLSSPGTR